MLRGAPGVRILATSREPMRAEGERILRSSPLGVPTASGGLTAAQAMTYPAIQLCVERATESLDIFELTEADAPVIADICRRLDGIALAIELAAGRVDTFGVRGLATLCAAMRCDKSASVDIEAIWTDALAIAEQVEDADYQLRAISGLRIVHLSNGNLRGVVALARRFKEVAARATDSSRRRSHDRLCVAFAWRAGRSAGRNSWMNWAMPRIAAIS